MIELLFYLKLSNFSSSMTWRHPLRVRRLSDQGQIPFFGPWIGLVEAKVFFKRDFGRMYPPIQDELSRVAEDKVNVEIEISFL